MYIIFYDCTADIKRVDKSPYMTEKIRYNTFEQPSNVDILRPVLTLTFQPPIPKSYNYCYIDTLERFYFITSMSEDLGGVIRIECLIDVRMSFINGSDFLFSMIRNEYRKTNVPDKELPINPSYHEPEVLPYDNNLFKISSGIGPGTPGWYDVIETL